MNSWLPAAVRENKPTLTPSSPPSPLILPPGKKAGPERAAEIKPKQLGAPWIIEGRTSLDKFAAILNGTTAGLER